MTLLNRYRAVCGARRGVRSGSYPGETVGVVNDVEGDVLEQVDGGSVEILLLAQVEMEQELAVLRVSTAARRLT